MKKYQKIIAIVLAVLVVAGAVTAFVLTRDKKEQTDLEYIKEKGTLVVGITDFEPIDYKDENGNWIGFDADMAKAFAEYLGVKVEFTEIEWDNKIMEVDSKTIDCVWNGMTLTDEVTSAMNCSNPYLNNTQVIIIPADKADEIKTIDDCKNLKFAVESGSAGKSVADANGFQYTEVKDQATALQEVAAGTCEAAIIDVVMATVTVGEGTNYQNLTYKNFSLSEEKYGVGFRKGSDLTNELNKFFADQKANGEMQKLAEQYKLTDALIK